MMLLERLNTIRRLGAVNFYRIARYRALLKLGRQSAYGNAPGAPPYFAAPRESSSLPVPNRWTTHTFEFGWRERPLAGRPPPWFCDVDGDTVAILQQLPWWQLKDFNDQVGDIKSIWELSRFDWVMALAQQWATGNSSAGDRLNQWLEDWLRQNPPYLGLNWKCGQEASIRVMHLAIAAMMLRQVDKPEKSLLELVSVHLSRIAPTLGYALAQDNNHGTSEAAALFIGGTWLLVAQHQQKEAKEWATQGRRWLEERALRLIAADGSFSQYSVNYHRLMLDTFCIAEVWRKQVREGEFADSLYRRLEAATDWLREFTNHYSGDAPNLGANDGANLLPLSQSSYRDFRPSVELASRVFLRQTVFGDEENAGITANWLGVTSKGCSNHDSPQPLKSRKFNDGGYAVLRSANTAGTHATVYFRYPRFRFRPGDADAFHIDLWLEGRNLLRDGGTYSYFTDVTWLHYFRGTASHNTVQFDGRDQMPRLSRFLFGRWLKTEAISEVETDEESLRIKASYRDGFGVCHLRSLELRDGQLTVRDEISGFDRLAVLRWRLEPGNWEWVGQTLSRDGMKVQVDATVPLSRTELVQGWESRFYQQLSTIPVLEIET